MISLNVEEVMSNKKIIGLDIEVFAKKTMMILVFKIGSGDIYIKNILTK